MIKLIIDSNKNLKKAATSKVFVGENEFEEITVSCNRRVLVNNIPDFSASLRVVIGENELSYPLAFSDTDSNTMTATVLIDTRMTRAVAELQFYVKFNSGEKVGMTNAIKIECKPNIESNGDEPYIPPIPLDDFVPRAQTIAGIDQYDAITAEELKAALDIEVSDGAKVFFEIFAPPYYVSDNDYCKIGDIWVDKEISTGQGYRVSVLMSKIYISDPGVYYCSWQPVVPASFNINVLPGGGNLPVHRYSETGGNTEYSYPPYRNGDILTVNGSDYECSVSDGNSYSSTYTYSFKRAVSEADISVLLAGKMDLIHNVNDTQNTPYGQIFSQSTNTGLYYYVKNNNNRAGERQNRLLDATNHVGILRKTTNPPLSSTYKHEKPTFWYNVNSNKCWKLIDVTSNGSITIDGVEHLYWKFTWEEFSKEDKSNKVTSFSDQSTDDQYPSALAVYNALQNKENTANKVTSLSSSSTDDQYPTAKCVYDELADKADSATTLAGYGIADAYTKTEVDALIPDISGKEDKIITDVVPPFCKSTYPIGTKFLYNNRLYEYIQAVDTIIITQMCVYRIIGRKLFTQNWQATPPSSENTANRVSTYRVGDLWSNGDTITANISGYLGGDVYICTKVQYQTEYNTVTYNYNWKKLPFDATTLNGYGIADAYTKTETDSLIPDISGKEDKSNKVTSFSDQSTDDQYPSAKAVYTSASGKENISNKVTSLSAQSTDTQYPSAKCVYDMIGDIESLLAEV